MIGYKIDRIRYVREGGYYRRVTSRGLLEKG